MESFFLPLWQNTYGVFKEHIFATLSQFQCDKNMFLKSHEPFRRMKFEERISRKRRSVSRRGGGFSNEQPYRNHFATFTFAKLTCQTSPHVSGFSLDRLSKRLYTNC